MLSNKMLDEGVHVDGIDGAIMLRSVDSGTTYLQEAGRCISSLDPNKPFSKQAKTQLIDTRGNTFKQINNKIGQKFSYRYDLEKIREIQEWIVNHNSGNIPDINKIPDIFENATEKEQLKAEAEKEARYAIALKRLKFRYSRYRNAKSFPIEAEDIIPEILNIADNISLWDVNIPMRKIEPSETELSGNGYLERMAPTQEKFMELYDKAVPKAGIGLTEARRISKLLHILSALKTYKKDLEFPQGISISLENKSIPEVRSDDVESLSLEDFLKANMTPEEVKEALVILQDPILMGAKTRSEMYHPGEEYDLGKEIAFVRGKLWTSQYDFAKSRRSYFSDYTLSDLIEIGLLQDGKKDIEKIGDLYYKYTTATATGKDGGTIKNAKYIDKYGRLTRENSIFDSFFDIHIGLVDEFESCSLYNGKKFWDGYDRDGYDKDGYDIFGYNRLGFNRKNIHKDTGDKYDQRGFYYDIEKKQWLNRYSGKEFDYLGYNVYGFNKDGISY